MEGLGPDFWPSPQRPFRSPEWSGASYLQSSAKVQRRIYKYWRCTVSCTVAGEGGRVGYRMRYGRVADVSVIVAVSLSTSSWRRMVAVATGHPWSAST